MAVPLDVRYGNKGGPWFIAGQKKERRKRMGWLKPLRCPKCRVFTRQTGCERGRRKCLACYGTFNHHMRAYTP